jgi:DNA-binding transcriptional LysR family regulator
MPLLAVDTADPTIDVRPLRPTIPARQICLVWRRDRTLAPVATRLIQIAADVATDLGHLPISA